jgi:hypothetical protein
MWAFQAGLDVTRRSKKLTPSIVQNVIAGLERGEAKSDMAEQNGISVVTVTRLLLSDVDLAQRWHDQISIRLQKTHRSHWLEAVGTTPAAGIKEIRQKAPATYAWLYRNDRIWLEDQKSRLPNKVLGNHRQVDWAQRDGDLSTQVVTQIHEIENRSPSEAVSRRTLIKVLPQLRSKMKQLKFMPLTTKVINLVRR